jgi:hypothetical protein
MLQMLVLNFRQLGRKLCCVLGLPQNRMCAAEEQHWVEDEQEVQIMRATLPRDKCRPKPVWLPHIYDGLDSFQSVP